MILKLYPVEVFCGRYGGNIFFVDSPDRMWISCSASCFFFAPLDVHEEGVAKGGAGCSTN